MALFGQDIPDPRVLAGGAALGDMLLGGPGQRAQGAYVEQFKSNAQAADAMWKARDNRARAIAREGITPGAVQQFGHNAQQAPLLASVLATADSPNLRNLGDFANPADIEIDNQRREALAKGDVPTYNRLTALAKDKAYQPARIEDGVVTPDGLGLGDEAFQVQPLPQTQALIEQREAGAARTRAGIANDAAKTGAYVARQGRAPAPRSSGKRGLTPEEVETRMAWITARATEYAKAGKPDGWVQAWMRNEALKSGIDMDSSVEAPAAGGNVAQEAWTQAEVEDAIASARAAVNAGRITKAEAAARLRAEGLHNAAARFK